MYSADDLRVVVKANIEGAKTLSDEDLMIPLLQGKRRLDKDAPSFAYRTLAGTGMKYYDLTQLSGWIDDYSGIDHIVYPAPVGQEAAPRLNPGLDYMIHNGNQLFVVAGLANGRSAMIYMSTPWSVAGLDGAVLTTINERMKNPLEFICSSMVALQLAGKASGTTESQMPADLLNYRSKEQEYRRVSAEYEQKYLNELGLPASMNRDTPKAAIVRAQYGGQRLTSGWPYLTHRGY